MSTLDFGIKVKERRLELGMSQLELAQKIGYKDKSSVAKIESGDRDLPRSKIVEIATALSVTPQFLLGWTEDDNDSITPQSLRDSSPVRGASSGMNTENASEQHLLSSFQSLNEDGQELAIDYVDSLAEKPKYLKKKASEASA